MIWLSKRSVFNIFFNRFVCFQIFWAVVFWIIAISGYGYWNTHLSLSNLDFSFFSYLVYIYFLLNTNSTCSNIFLMSILHPFPPLSTMLLLRILKKRRQLICRNWYYMKLNHCLFYLLWCCCAVIFNWFVCICVLLILLCRVN